MVSSVVVFCPRPELSASDNLRGFIESARSNLQVFGADLHFDDNVWDITDAVDLKGRGNKRVRINFFAFTENENSTVPMREPFLSFAKAYFRYIYALRPTKSVHPRLYALKALEYVLANVRHTGEIETIHAQHFDAAATRMQTSYCEKVAYRTGSELETLATFLTENGFAKVPVRWHNFLPRPSDTQRVGKEFDERRAAKLPSEAALNALPQLFRLAEKPLDVIATSITALLLSAPNRISETLLLPANCEVVQDIQDRTTYRLRWWPSKGADPMLKPVYSGMADVVKEAIKKLRTVSAPAREIAAWYEEHPGRLYLPAGLEHLRSETYIKPTDVAAILGVIDGSRWCKLEGINITEVDGVLKVRLEDVERKIVSLLPIGFPFLHKETGLKYSEALILVRKNELHAQRGTYLCMIEPVPTDTLNVTLGAPDRESVFDRFGFKEPDGSRINITTHQFRHYLTTVAQMGGLCQLDIAKWAGRVDVRQNEAYIHVTPDQMLTKIRDAVGVPSQMRGPLGVAPDRRLISRDEFAQLKVPTAHVTELGFCIHDYTMMPCEIHRDCINCEELVCIKGDGSHNAEVKRQLEEARVLLLRAESAYKDEFYGSDRWMDHQRATVERLEQLCAILEDSTVPIGAFITLASPRTGSKITNTPRSNLAGPRPQLLTGGDESQ